jgi:hypothetical protein
MDPIWAGETDVRAETLEAAASLLVLRRDTLRLIDGAGPDIEAPQSKSNGLEKGNVDWDVVGA